jgi:hypothetical protein
MTIRAHKDSVVLRLARLFDPSARALSLGNLLQTGHSAITNPAFQTPGLNVPGLDAAEIQLELAEVSENDAIVSRLIGIRNEYLAHRGSRLVRSGSFAGLPELEKIDFEILLNRGSRIGDKYSWLYGGKIASKHLPGGDDYKRLLRLLKLGMTSQRKYTEPPRSTDT